MDSFLLLQWDVFSFAFWKKLKSTKRLFEIIWPLILKKILPNTFSNDFFLTNHCASENFSKYVRCDYYLNAFLTQVLICAEIKLQKFVRLSQSYKLCTVTVKSFIKCANFLKIVRPFSCIYCSAYLCKKSSCKSL